MKVNALVLMLATLAVAALAAEPEPVTAQQVVERMLAAAGAPAFRELGVLELEISEEETTSDGSSSNKRFTAFVDASNLVNLRLDLSRELVLGCHNGVGWAVRDGQLDGRQQAPRMAAGSIRQRLFPLLLPHSLRMDGVAVAEPALVGVFEGEQVWQLAVTFEDFFFASPVMGSTWHLVVRRSDATVISAEFLPPEQFRSSFDEGVRYRPLVRAAVDGAQLATRVLLDGIDLKRSPTGHVRTVQLAARPRAPFEPELFVRPDLVVTPEQAAPGGDQSARP